MTRNGKIARLPLSIRNTVGQRLRDGETGKTVVDWLNSLPEVQNVMAAEFSGRPVTEQNLSEWKQGAYPEWLRHQESLEWAAQMREQETELAETVGTMPLSDGSSSLMSIALGRMLRESMAKPLENAEHREQMLALAREMARLRRVDQRAVLVKIKQDEYAALVRSRQEARARYEAKENHWNSVCNNINQLAAQHLQPK